MNRPHRLNLRQRRWSRNGLWYSLLLVTMIMLIGGVGFWILDPRVLTLNDGLWLAFTTAATVGYGDLVPSTHASRAFSIFVVLMGLAVLSLVTASLSALFLEREVKTEEKQIERDLMRELTALRADMQKLREEVQKQAPRPAPLNPSESHNA